MAKLTLNAAPTFKAKVGVPVAGGASVDVEFTFRHRTKKQLEEFVQGISGQKDVDTFMAMVIGWELEDEFNPANVEKLLDNYIGAALAIYQAYLEELVKAKEKN